jgi:hypothetical protein
VHHSPNTSSMHLRPDSPTFRVDATAVPVQSTGHRVNRPSHVEREGNPSMHPAASSSAGARRGSLRTSVERASMSTYRMLWMEASRNSRNTVASAPAPAAGILQPPFSLRPEPCEQRSSWVSGACARREAAGRNSKISPFPPLSRTFRHALPVPSTCGMAARSSLSVGFRQNCVWQVLRRARKFGKCCAGPPRPGPHHNKRQKTACTDPSLECSRRPCLWRLG